MITRMTRLIGAPVLTAVAFSIGACSGSSNLVSPPISQSANVSTASDTGGKSAPAPTQANTAGSGAELPRDWPAGIPTPTGLTLDRVLSSPTGPGSIAIYRGVGTAGVVNTQMTQDLKAAGFTERSSIGAPVFRSTWTKGSTSVALNISSAVGKASCAITARSA